MLEYFPKEFSKAAELCSDIKIDKPINLIVMAGMGGSSYPGSICKTYLEDISFDIPIEICRDYSLNKNITEKTLVFVSSYSGNTDEAVDCYLDAVSKKCQILVITSGGRLLELASKYKTPVVKIIDDHSKTHPVVSTGYFIGITLCILENSGLLKGATNEIKTLEGFLYGLKIRGLAKAIAKKMYNKIPVIYTSTKYAESVSRVIKIRLNENAKVPAFYNAFPELTHYEPASFIQRYSEFHFVLIEDPGDSFKVNTHITAFERVFAKKYNVTMTKVVMKGENTLQKIVGVIYLFEWVTLYLADMYKIDPFSLGITLDLKKFTSSEKEESQE